MDQADGSSRANPDNFCGDTRDHVPARYTDASESHEITRVAIFPPSRAHKSATRNQYFPHPTYLASRLQETHATSSSVNTAITGAASTSTLIIDQSSPMFNAWRIGTNILISLRDPPLTGARTLDNICPCPATHTQSPASSHYLHTHARSLAYRNGQSRLPGPGDSDRVTTSGSSPQVAYLLQLRVYTQGS